MRNRNIINNISTIKHPGDYNNMYDLCGPQLLMGQSSDDLSPLQPHKMQRAAVGLSMLIWFG